MLRSLCLMATLSLGVADQPPQPGLRLQREGRSLMLILDSARIGHGLLYWSSDLTHWTPWCAVRKGAASLSLPLPGFKTVPRHFFRLDFTNNTTTKGLTSTPPGLTLRSMTGPERPCTCHRTGFGVHCSACRTTTHPTPTASIPAQPALPIDTLSGITAAAPLAPTSLPATAPTTPGTGFKLNPGRSPALTVPLRQD